MLHQLIDLDQDAVDRRLRVITGMRVSELAILVDDEHAWDHPHRVALTNPATVIARQRQRQAAQPLPDQLIARSAVIPIDADHHHAITPRSEEKTPELQSQIHT